MLENHNPFGSLILGLVLWAAAAGAQPGQGLKLHVTSPDWRDQIIYFVLTDRFADGDASNNDQGAGEFKPGAKDFFNGGDLAGLTQQLDYIKGLGATALWITPPVANQWLSPDRQSAGYHGYWAEHFMQLDRHLGTLADYQRLSHELHSAGMVLVQDIVVNHTGDFFSYGPDRSAAEPARGYVPHDRTPPVARPSQPPFDRNDPRDPAHRRDSIYHWTPDVSDFNDPKQERNFQMSGLDDLNTENPLVRRALRQSYGHWIREVGVDAFRVDTAFYVPPEYFEDLLNSRDPKAPGISEVARRTGRRNFLVFGEGFGIDGPGQDKATRKIERYMTAPDGRARMPGMLNFPLYGALGDAFARGHPPAELGGRITKMMKLHARPHWMPSFVDNHDVDRFLAGGNVTGLKQALLAIMTLPGIPVIYYGTEQGFTEQRAAMFKAGFGSGGKDHYDREQPLYRAIAEMSALRRSHRLLSRGHPTVLAGNGAQPGALAWRIDNEGEAALVIFNTAEHEALLPAIGTGLPAGSLLEGLYGLDGRPKSVIVGTGGRITLRLAARSGQVWKLAAQRASVAATLAAPRVDPLPRAPRAGDFPVSGRAAAGTRLELVVDGDLAAATPVVADASGRWRAVVDTGRMIDPSVRHQLTAWAEGGAAAPSRDFRVTRSWQAEAEAVDPEGDDRGPNGTYSYPTDPGWGDNHQMDLRGVKVWQSGGAMKLDLKMRRITQSWNPPQGFDHVVFTVYIELPGRDGGATVMPLQNALLPPGMRWHLRLRAGGWSTALFSAEGASSTAEGTPVTPGASVRADPRTQTVSITLPAAALGRLKSLSGAKIYITTWDYDSGYRALEPQAQAHSVGGAGADAPKVMDDSEVIVIP